MKELLRLADVSVSYGRTQVLRSVNLSVYAGEFCALLGLNGSGKTTLLHAACGFLPMGGACFADGKNLAGLHERQRARLISFLSQGSAPEGGRSVLDVVLMGFNARLGLLEFPSREHRRMAEETLAQLGCAYLKDWDCGALSQGQKQIAVLARCLAQDTPVILMDEPDSALDFLNRHMALGKVRDLIRCGSRAGLITLHDPNFAMAYCDRIFLLKDGGIAAEINMRGASPAAVGQALEKVYGNIEILPRNDSFLMWKASR